MGLGSRFRSDQPEAQVFQDGLNDLPVFNEGQDAHDSSTSFDRLRTGLRAGQGIDFDFPYTHNIGRLLELCAEKEEWAKDLPEADELTPFAITARYPSQDEAVTREESLRAIEIASKIRATLRKVLEKMGMNLPLDSE